MVLIMLIDRNVFSNKSFAQDHGELLMIGGGRERLRKQIGPIDPDADSDDDDDDHDDDDDTNDDIGGDDEDGDDLYDVANDVVGGEDRG